MPGLHELAGYSAYANATMNPLASMDKMMKQMPGFGDAFEPLMKEMQNAGPVLRVHMDLFMPAIAALLQHLPAGENVPPALDPSAPFFQINQELVELSTAPVPEGAFQIPDGYQESAPVEVIQAYLAKAKAALPAAGK